MLREQTKRMCPAMEREDTCTFLPLPFVESCADPHNKRYLRLKGAPSADLRQYLLSSCVSICFAALTEGPWRCSLMFQECSPSATRQRQCSVVLLLTHPRTVAARILGPQHCQTVSQTVPPDNGQRRVRAGEHGGPRLSGVARQLGQPGGVCRHVCDAPSAGRRGRAGHHRRRDRHQRQLPG